VRLDKVQITNYGGISRAEVSGLAEQAVVTVTGRNGTGKSLFLEAIAQVLGSRGPAESRVGPWGTGYEVLLTVVLDPTEQRTAADWFAARSSSAVHEVAPRAELGIKGSSNGWEFLGDEWARILLHDERFRESHPFLDLSFLPAVRAVRADRQGALELDSLDPERVRRSRGEGIERALSRGEPLLTPTVSSQLTALHYLDLLADRDGLASKELQRVVEVFEVATGKRIIPPRAGVGSTARFEAMLADGARHSVNDLSSGERAMLSLLFYVRRVATQGGLLLIDEPEQHLHPTLVAPLMASMVELAPEAQIFVVTHAAGAIAAASGSAVLVLDQPHESRATQLRRAQEDASFDVLSELGLSAPELLGVDGLVVVEGPDDEEFLRSVFPVYASRLRIVQAGGVKQALKYCETLTLLRSWVSWLCIIDRDLRTASEVAQLTAEHANLFIWLGRDVESLYLSGPLIAAAYRAVGKEVDEGVIERELRSSADYLRGEVIRTMTTERAVALARRGPRGSSSACSHGKAWLEERSRVFRRAAEEYDNVKLDVESEVLDRWESDWRGLSDPKAVLQRVVARFGYFSKQTPIDPVIRQRFTEDPNLRPPELKELERRLAEVVGAKPLQAEVSPERGVAVREAGMS